MSPIHYYLYILIIHIIYAQPNIYNRSYYIYLPILNRLIVIHFSTSSTPLMLFLTLTGALVGVGYTIALAICETA